MGRERELRVKRGRKGEKKRGGVRDGKWMRLKDSLGRERCRQKETQWCPLWSLKAPFSPWTHREPLLLLESNQFPLHLTPPPQSLAVTMAMLGDTSSAFRETEGKMGKKEKKKLNRAGKGAKEAGREKTEMEKER